MAERPAAEEEGTREARGGGRGSRAGDAVAQPLSKALSLCAAASALGAAGSYVAWRWITDWDVGGTACLFFSLAAVALGISAIAMGGLRRLALASLVTGIAAFAAWLVEVAEVLKTT